MKIWDLHCHIAGPSLPTADLVKRAEHLIAVAERMGIERLCVFMGAVFVHDPSPGELRKQNDQLLSLLEKFSDRVWIAQR